MKNVFKTLTCLFLFVLPTTILADDLIEPSKDLYVRNTLDTTHGDESRLIVKKTHNGDSIWTRKIIIQFEFNPTYVIDDTAFYLDLVLFDRNNGTSTNYFDYFVWGLADGSSLEDFDESTADYYDFIPALNASWDGVTNANGHLHDADPNQPDKQKLGILRVLESDLNKTVEFKTPALTEFLRRDTDGVITIILTPKTDDPDVVTAFASKEHSNNSPARLFVETRDEIVEAADDAYGRKGSGSAQYGTETELLIRRKNDGAGSNTRKAVIEFNLNDQTSVKDAELMLDLISCPEETKVFVWGVDDSSSLENINDSTFSYNTYSSIFNNSKDGVDNGSDHLYNYGVELGTFTVDSSMENSIVTFSSEDLINFINDDEDGVVTFILTSGDDNSTTTNFAAIEHSSRQAPRLWLDHTIQKEVASVEIALEYAYVDDDNILDLVLVITSPDGSAYATAEPIFIADLMTTLGFGLGSGTDFYDSLSPTQQNFLRESLGELVNEPSASVDVDGSYIEVQVNNFPAGRTLGVVGVENSLTLQAGIDDGTYVLMGSYQEGEAHEYSNGDVTITLTGESAQAGAAISEDGVVMGAEASKATLGMVIGDENGSYLGFSGSAGDGLWAEAKWGQDGQYGGSIPIPCTPIQITVYLEGDDAVAAFNWAAMYTRVGIGSMRDWSKDAWDDSLTWGSGTVVVLEDALNATKLFVKNHGKEAAIWCADAGESTWVYLSGGTNSVMDACDEIADSAIAGFGSGTTTAVDTVTDWVDDAGSIVSSAWDDASGWFKGSADKAAKGFKKFVKSLF